MLDHYYQNIHGWFTFPNLYGSAVKGFDNAVFVEVGSWLGKSSVFMGVEIINSGKRIRMDCVDIWQMTPDYQQYDLGGKDLYDLFLQNILPVKSVVRPVKKTSVAAAATYQQESVDFIFIDGSHHFQDVRDDLRAWWPKLKPGGFFAGHDYTNSAEVRSAVDEWLCLNNLALTYNNEQCWGLTK